MRTPAGRYALTLLEFGPEVGTRMEIRFLDPDTGNQTSQRETTWVGYANVNGLTYAVVREPFPKVLILR